MKDKVVLQIYGREFEVEAEGLSPLELYALAEEITAKMKELSAQSKIADSSKLAILTALNYAEELSRLRKQVEGSQETDHRKVEEMILTLQEATKAGS